MSVCSAFCVVAAFFYCVLPNGSFAELDLNFPPHFQFGAASAAYQIEGAWNVSDKGESIWDHLCHTEPNYTPDQSNGDIACDSYHKYERDVEMLTEIGVMFYRFSTSWTRILPTGFPNVISEDGIRYYNALLDKLDNHHITAVVTIYHWDMPREIQQLGGWTNPYMVDWLTDYAEVLFRLFGHRVKIWITINEPIAICDLSYTSQLTPPRYSSPDHGNYLCNKHVLLAHAKIYDLYHKKYNHDIQGRVSITNVLFWYSPQTPEDEAATDLAVEYSAGRYSHPIYSEIGGWPSKLKKYVEEKSLRQGYFRSRLPELTPEEIEKINGSYDFYAINYYTARMVRRATPNEKVGVFPMDGMTEFGVVLEGHPSWPKGCNDWFFFYAEGLRLQLNWLKENYKGKNGQPLEIFITENGYPSCVNESHSLLDVNRVIFYYSHLKAVLEAIHLDKVNVTGYTAWTLMDNFEWFDGFTTRFGLYEVDFSSPERTRTPRLSAFYYKEVISKRKLISPLVFLKSQRDRLSPDDFAYVSEQMHEEMKNLIGYKPEREEL